MPAIILILLIAMFSLSLWANPGQSGCDILLRTPYGKLMRMFALTGTLTAEELEDLAKKEEPTNPFAKHDRTIGNQAFRRVVNRDMTDSDLLANWPATRKALAELATRMRKAEATVDQASEKTKPVFNPKLVASYGPGEFNFLFNPVTNQMIAWKTRFRPTEAYNGTAYFVHDLKTHKRTVGRLGRFAEIFVSKSGEVWSAAVHRNSQIVVLRWPSRTPHVILPFNGEGNFTFFETPNGEMLLADSTNSNGLFVYDVTLANNPRTFLATEAEKHRIKVNFHVSQSGQVYLASPADLSTRVYRLENDHFAEVGKIKRTPGPRNTFLAMTTDENDAIYLGEAVETREGYRVLKLVNGRLDELFSREDLSGNGHTAVFHWNSKGELILGLSRIWSEKIFQLVNISDPSAPEIKVAMDSQMEVRPSWFKLPNGQEVIALSPHIGRPMVIDATDGTVLWTASIHGNSNNQPVWMQGPDGKIHLAFDIKGGVQIYDMWRSDHD